jgi:hypothetical protein
VEGRKRGSPYFFAHKTSPIMRARGGDLVNKLYRLGELLCHTVAAGLMVSAVVWLRDRQTQISRQIINEIWEIFHR